MIGNLLFPFECNNARNLILLHVLHSQEVAQESVSNLACSQHKTSDSLPCSGYYGIGRDRERLQRVTSEKVER